MKYRRSIGEVVFDLFNMFFMICLILVTLYPFYYILIASFSDPTLLIKARGFFTVPLGFSTSAYDAVISNPLIRIGYLNTLFYVVGGTTLGLLLTSFGAYALSRRKYLGRDFFMIVIVITMFFSGGLIPTFLLVKSLGLLDTRFAVFIPTAINTWNLIIMRTAFRQVPFSLEESAKMDGANDFTILFRIFLPVSLPVVAVMILFYSVHYWNEFFYAMIYLRTRTLYPLQLFLREIIIASSAQSMMTGVVSDRAPIGQTIKYATIILTTLPILVVYPFLQRYFVRGVMIGAIKE
ncbi:MAG TPA: carbohydrate ABC transporter permease [Spirochaetia bacterium]|nr:carbohydrate ABC transporter permease [Spirochaetia bacterium]